jgi:hypothetical protein
MDGQVYTASMVAARPTSRPVALLWGCGRSGAQARPSTLPASGATEKRDVPRPLARGIASAEGAFHTEGLKRVDATSIS